MDDVVKNTRSTVPFDSGLVPETRLLYFDVGLNDTDASISEMPGSAAPTVEASISHEVYLGLTVVFVTLYALLFVLITYQLCFILYYKHRRLSYQSVFLFVCLIWAALRTTLFCFYFNDNEKANHLSAFPRWLLFAFPVYLQFVMLTILTLYLAKVVLKSRRTSLEPYKFRRYLLVAFATVNVIFLGINVTSSILCPEQNVHEMLVVARVLITGVLFVVVGVMLCFCIRKITRIPAATILLEGHGATTRQGVVLCVVVFLFYLSRVVYNLVAVTVPHDVSSFGYGWINVSDEGEIKYKKTGRLHEDIRDEQFITFGVVLIVWEVLPTFIVVWFFRVRRPHVGDMGPSAIASQSYDKKSFFNNPRRYDSDEDLSTAQGSVRSNYNIPGVLSPSSSSVNVNRSRSYGSIGGARSSNSYQKSNSYSNPYMPGTTPPLLFSGSGYQPNALIEHHNEGQ